MWTDNARTSTSGHDHDRDGGHSCHDYVGLAQARPNYIPNGPYVEVVNIISHHPVDAGYNIHSNI